MAEERLNFDDLFGNDLEKKIQDLQNTTNKFINTLNNDLTQSFDNVKQASKATEQQLEKTDATSAAGRKNIDALAKSVDNLSKEEQRLVQTQKQVNQATEATSKSINGLKQQLKEQRAEFNNLDTSTAAGQKRFMELRQEIAKTSVEIRAINQEVKRSEKEFEAQRNAVRGTAKSYQDLQNESRAIINRLKTMDNAINQVTGEWNEQDPAVKSLVKRYKEVQNVLKSTDSQLGNFQRNVGDYNNAIQQAANGLSGQGGLSQSFGVLGNAANNVLPGIGDNITNIVGKLGPAGIAAGALGAAFVGAFDTANDLAKEIGPQLQSVRAIIGGTDDEVRNLTAGIRATANAFDRDFNEVLKGTNALIENFGIDGEESLGLINSALIQGFDLNQDLLDQLSEYSVQFAAAGFSAEQFFAVQRLGADQGIFNDKAADTVKEFGLRIRELTPATQAALIPLGEATNEQIRLAVESGNTAEALSLVAGGLEDVDLTAQQTQTIIADVFGGPGEDAGLAFIKTLRNINGEFKTLEELVENADGELNAFQQSQAEILLLSRDFERSQVDIAAAFGASGDAFSKFTLSAKTFFNDVLARGIVEFRLFAATVQGFFSAIGDADFTGISDRVAAERAKVFISLSQARKEEEAEQEAFNQRRLAAQVDADRKLGLERLRIQSEIQNLLLERQIGFEQELVDNQETAAADRVGALVRIGQLRIMQEQNTLDAILANDKLSDLEREKELIAHKNRIIDIEREFGAKIREVRKSDNELLLELDSADFVKRELSQEDFLDSMFARAQKDAERRLAQNEKELRAEADKAARRREIETAALDGLQMGLEAAFQLRNAALEAQFQSELSSLEARQMAELEAAGENEEAKKAIALRFDEERRRLEAERARKDKQNAIFEATISTAVAITRALASAAPPLNFIAAGIAAVQGAAQIAAIAATPIPAFEKGTKSSPAGVALVGEAGPELIKSPSGDYSLVTEPSLQYLKGGSQVYTADETRALAEAAAMGTSGETVGTAADATIGITSELRKMIGQLGQNHEQLVETLANQRKYIFEVSTAGIKAVMEHKGNKTEYYNQRY